MIRASAVCAALALLVLRTPLGFAMLVRLRQAVSRAEEICVASLLAFATIMVFADVMSRFLLSSSISWGPESVRYSIVWMVFIGSSIAVRKGVHISIDVLRELLPPALRRPLTLLTLSITAAFCALLLWFGVQLVQLMHQFGQVSPAMQAPMWAMYLALPAGGGLMLLRLLEASWRVLATGAELERVDDARQVAG